MALEKQYQPAGVEPALEARWQSEGIYHYEEGPGPVFSIDTPPPTVSGRLHLGHVYSYSHPDFIARYRRMRGDRVYYPMGFDDNGLPTERLVEKTLGKRAREIDPAEFSRLCLEVAEEAEKEYRGLFQRLGLSCDWRYTYRTIDRTAQRYSQYSFIDLYRKGLAYRAKAPAIWCPECRASFAQADLEDRPRASEFVTLPFGLPDGQILAIATTRPELLAACVAVFVHPGDARYHRLIGKTVQVPLYGWAVPVIADIGADPQKGTGAVMCCTFGDQADVTWQRSHHLAVIEAIDEGGQMTALADLPGWSEAERVAGLPVEEARRKIKAILADRGLILERTPVEQTVRVHERCDTPVEYRVVDQWFIRVLEHKDTFLRLGEQITWRPAFMAARYRAWVENLNWDWSISRQRYHGVPFPAWFCADCGETKLAEVEDLPVDPRRQKPLKPCACGSSSFRADTDVMDTWATSSVSPQIAGGWLEDDGRFESLFPFDQRPQAHEIIRTWLFYSVVKSWYHTGKLPWKEALISGWAIAGEGMAKISKSKGGGPMAPAEMIGRYSADGLRYWAASTSVGKDAIISEEKIQMGMKLATKLWNVARFAERFLSLGGVEDLAGNLSPADSWIRAGCAGLVDRVSAAYDEREYSQAKTEIENFFWRDLADNYLEMIKQRLYRSEGPDPAAVSTLKVVFRTVLQLLAPILPYVTEAIWQELFAREGGGSIHRSAWPDARRLDPGWDRDDGGDFGETLIAIAGAVRRYKSEHSLSLASELDLLAVGAEDEAKRSLLAEAQEDLLGITRGQRLVVGKDLPDGSLELAVEKAGLRVAIILVR